MQFSTEKFNEVTRFHNLGEVARNSGFSPQTLWNMRRGINRNPSSQLIAALSKVLKVPMESFFE